MDESILEKTFKNTLYIFGGNNSHRKSFYVIIIICNLTKINLEKRKFFARVIFHKKLKIDMVQDLKELE